MWLSEKGRKEPKQCVVRRKEVAWEEVLAARDEEANERCMETYGEKRERLRVAYIRAKRK